MTFSMCSWSGVIGVYDMKPCNEAEFFTAGSIISNTESCTWLSYNVHDVKSLVAIPLTHDSRFCRVPAIIIVDHTKVVVFVQKSFKTYSQMRKRVDER